MQDLVTITSIENWFRENVEQRIPIAPSKYLDAAQKIVVLLSNLDDDLTTAEMAVNRRVAAYMESGDSAAGAKLKVKALPEYENYLRMNAQKERAIEFIRICKKKVEIQQWDN